MKRYPSYLVIFFLLLIGASTSMSEKNGVGKFQSNCAMCHGADGTGNTPVGKALQVPSFHDPAVMQYSDAELTTIIHDGKERMPAFAGTLRIADIQKLVAYIRTLQAK